MMKYNVTSDNATVFINGQKHVLTKDNMHFNAVKAHLLGGSPDEETLVSLLDSEQLIKQWSDGRYTVKDGVVHDAEGPLPDALSKRVMSLVKEGQPVEPVLRFWLRLKANPSYRSVEQLWGFMQHTGIPLTDSGYLLTYKSVRADLRDHHSGTYENNPGKVLSMPRNKISDDPKEACHFGFHVGALAYVDSTYSDRDSRKVICRVDPADVVCVPYDASQQKIRVCKYEVVGFFTGKLPDDLVHDVDLPKPKKVYVDSVDEERLSQTSKTKGKSYDLDKLMVMSLDQLRKHASNDLHIVGASKIPGGRYTLIELIMSNSY